jgi:hypothetical protein
VIGLDRCDFRVDNISWERLETYDFLDAIAETDNVIRLDDFICDEIWCKTHAGRIWMYRDAKHLTAEGAALLGKQHDFYGLITGDRAAHLP